MVLHSNSPDTVFIVAQQWPYLEVACFCTYADALRFMRLHTSNYALPIITSRSKFRTTVLNDLLDCVSDGGTKVVKGGN